MIEAFGLEFRRQVGSHRIQARPNIQKIVNVQPAKDGKAKDIQVKDVLELIEHCGLRLGDDRP